MSSPKAAPEHTRQAPKGRWGLRVKLLALSSSSLIGFVFIELCLRLLSLGDPEFIQIDDRLGFSLRPGASGWNRGEGNSYVRINRHGMRDAEHSVTKPADTFRIAVLGDSFAEARQVPQGKTFWSLLAGDLARCRGVDGARVEVLNFGVSGYGTAQELVLLQDRVWEFQPDLVLLAFFAGNDVRNNSKALEWEPIRPFYAFEDGRLVLDDGFRTLKAFRTRRTVPFRLFYWAHQNFRTVQLLKKAFGTLARRAGGRGTAERNLESGLDSSVLRDPKEPRWAEAWKVTEGVITLMRDEVRRHGALFGVVSLSNGIQSHPDPRVRDRVARSLGVGDLFYPDKRLVEFLGRQRVPALALAPAFQGYAERHNLYLHGFGSTGTLGQGHWNEHGHRLAAELISEWLCGWLPQNLDHSEQEPRAKGLTSFRGGRGCDLYVDRD